MQDVKSESKVEIDPETKTFTLIFNDEMAEGESTQSYPMNSSEGLEKLNINYGFNTFGFIPGIPIYFELIPVK